MKDNLVAFFETMTLLAYQGKEQIVIGPRTVIMLRALLAFQDEIEASNSGCVSFHYAKHEVQARHDKRLGYWKVES